MPMTMSGIMIVRILVIFVIFIAHILVIFIARVLVIFINLLAMRSGAIVIIGLLVVISNLGPIT